MPQGGTMGLPNLECHENFIMFELVRLLEPKSYASMAWKLIGAEIHDILEQQEEESDTPFDYAMANRSNFLHIWAKYGGGFDVEWLSDEKGIYLQDNGEYYVADTPISLSPVEHLATYGLYLLKIEMRSRGSTEYFDTRINERGFPVTEVIFHRAACLMAAYQCLLLATKELHTTRGPKVQELIDDELKRRAAKHGEAGAARKNQKRKEVINYTIDLYRSRGPWQSKKQAAFHIWKAVFEYAKTVPYVLRDTNAEQTVYQWIREYGDEETTD